MSSKKVLSYVVVLLVAVGAIWLYVSHKVSSSRRQKVVAKLVTECMAVAESTEFDKPRVVATLSSTTVKHSSASEGDAWRLRRRGRSLMASTPPNHVK